ncbi:MULTISPECIES: hypothetical protein [Allobaculum]|uniref:hypothetical protein n=1 Tax=Allobaculum TaxID=174708 RepID=UPI001E4EEA0F|nr:MULTISPECIES: hypothetical protein [Allobaculum]UNT94281.1 hypothetical protein KWG61_06695 [Allobaculum sp. Allo2]
MEAMGIAILLLIALVILDGIATSFAVGDDWISFMDQMLMLVPPVFTAFLTTEDLSFGSILRKKSSALFASFPLLGFLSRKPCLSAYVLDSRLCQTKLAGDVVVAFVCFSHFNDGFLVFLADHVVLLIFAIEGSSVPFGIEHQTVCP